MSEQSVPSVDETPFEILWQELTEDILVRVYVPEADQMSHEEALKLAQERDIEAAWTLFESMTQLDTESAVIAATEP